MSAADDDLVAVLEAERQIGDQLNAICRAVDRFDRELFTSAWHPDGTLEDVESGMSGMVTELVDRIIDRYAAWDVHQHQVTNVSIEVAGDRAVSESFVMATMRSAAKDDGRYVDTHYRGRCLDRWSNRDGRWAIDHRLSVGSFGWEQTVTEDRPHGSSGRDRSDPVYEMFAFIGEPASHLPGDPAVRDRMQGGSS